ncbi:MAG: 50S ribosomal protein L25/general stress protein Ctc [Bdellovibrionales bacterium]
MTQATMQASVRSGGGKGNARATRRNGQVPAVIYGNNEKPLLIMLDKNKVSQQLERASFFTHLLNLEVDGKKHMVLPRDAQLDPVTDQPLHLDFLRVTDKTEIRIAVPVHVSGAEKSPGVKRGGVVNIVSHELDLYCQAGSIPESITIDVSELDIGDSIHMGTITLPKGSRLISADDADEMTLVTIAAPTALRDEAKEAAAKAEAEAAAAEAAAAAPAAAGAAAPAAGAAAPAAGAAAPAAKK